MQGNGTAPRSAENTVNSCRMRKMTAVDLGLLPLLSFPSQGDREAAEDQPSKCTQKNGASCKQALAIATLVWESPSREAGLTDDAERFAGKF